MIFVSLWTVFRKHIKLMNHGKVFLVVGPPYGPCLKLLNGFCYGVSRSAVELRSSLVFLNTRSYRDWHRPVIKYGAHLRSRL
jgi:hypothetical protein